MFAAIGRAVVRRPWWVIISWLLAAGCLVAVAPRLSTITTSDQSSFLPDGAESARAAGLARRTFPDADSSTGIIVVSRPGNAPLGGADVATIATAATRLRSGMPRAVREVRFDPTMVAANRAVALVQVRFAGDPQSRAVVDAVGAVRAGTARALAGSGLHAGMTGDAAIVRDNRDAMAHAERIVTIATVVLIVALLLVLFRGLVAALLPLLTVGLVYATGTAAIAAAGRATGLRIGQEVPVMLIVVLFGIGTDYLLFLLFRYRERLRAGDTPHQAVVTAVARVGEAIFSAGIAVIAAFGALALAALGFFATLGPSLAIGVAIMLLAVLTLVPAVLAVAGHRVFWPSRSATGAARGARAAGAGRFVVRHPLVLSGVAVVVLAGLATGLAAFRPSYDPVASLPSGTEATRAFQALTRGFPAGALAPTEIYLHRGTPFSAAELGRYVAHLATAPGVATPGPPTVARDGRTVRIPVILREAPFSDGALAVVSGPLRAAARAAAPPGAQVLVGGQSIAFADVQRTTDRDLRLIFPVAAGLFLLILGVMLRAALAPVYLVAMVAAGSAAALGAAALALQVAGDRAGLHFAMPIVLYLFVTAIGTDYNILVTARLREELRDGAPPREAGARAVALAGPSVAAAAAILAGTFASLLISGVPFFVEIGFGVTAGIVLVAFVISLLLVPAVTALLGRYAWWPGLRPDTRTGPGPGGTGLPEPLLSRRT